MRNSRWRAALLAPEAAFWLAVSWLTLDVLDRYRYRSLIPQPGAAASADASRSDATGVRTRGTIERVRRAVWAVSRRMPVRSVCFHRAIAAHRMLRARGIATTMHYGVARRDDGALHAHVWLTCNGADVVGTRDAEGFTEIATLAPGMARAMRDDSGR